MQEVGPVRVRKCRVERMSDIEAALAERTIRMPMLKNPTCINCACSAANWGLTRGSKREIEQSGLHCIVCFPSIHHAKFSGHLATADFAYLCSHRKHPA